jgi:hypothetical protein
MDESDRSFIDVESIVAVEGTKSLSRLTRSKGLQEKGTRYEKSEARNSKAVPPITNPTTRRVSFMKKKRMDQSWC